MERALCLLSFRIMENKMRRQFLIIAIACIAVSPCYVYAQETNETVSTATDNGDLYGKLAGILNSVAIRVQSMSQSSLDAGRSSIKNGKQLMQMGEALFLEGKLESGLNLMQEGSRVLQEGIEGVAEGRAFLETAKGLRFMESGLLSKLSNGAEVLAHTGNAITVVQSLASDFKLNQDSSKGPVGSADYVGSGSSSYITQFATRVLWDVGVGVGSAVLKGDVVGASSDAAAIVTKSLRDIGAGYIEAENAWADAELAAAGLRETEMQRYKQVRQILNSPPSYLLSAKNELEELRQILNAPRPQSGGNPSTQIATNTTETGTVKPEVIPVKSTKVTKEEADKIQQSVLDDITPDYPTAPKGNTTPTVDTTGAEAIGKVASQIGVITTQLGSQNKEGEKGQNTDNKTVDPVTSKPVTFEAVTSKAVTSAPVTYSGNETVTIGDNYLGDGLSFTYATDTSSWDDWIDNVGRTNLQRLVDNTKYPNIATMLSDWKQLITNANDPSYVTWANQQPSGLGTTGGINIQGRWSDKLSMLELGRILSRDFKADLQISGEKPKGLDRFTPINVPPAPTTPPSVVADNTPIVSNAPSPVSPSAGAINGASEINRLKADVKVAESKFEDYLRFGNLPKPVGNFGFQSHEATQKLAEEMVEAYQSDPNAMLKVYVDKGFKPRPPQLFSTQIYKASYKEAMKLIAEYDAGPGKIKREQEAVALAEAQRRNAIVVQEQERLKAIGIQRAKNEASLAQLMAKQTQAINNDLAVAAQRKQKIITTSNTATQSTAVVEQRNPVLPIAAARPVPINWARIQRLRGISLGVISNNISHIGSTAGTGTAPIRNNYNTGFQGTLVSGQALEETPFSIMVGDASTHLSEHGDFGTIVSPGGMITSVNNAGVAVTIAEKQYTLPDGQRTFSFSTNANFVTTEFPEFVGTEFNDTGKVTIVTPAGREFTLNTVFSEAVNSSSFTPVSNLPAPLQKDDGLATPTGGQTGFSSVGVTSLPVTPGGTVILRVEVENIGDTSYPSAVLLNNTQAR
jgi:hypothetical protein